jgi:hypothetical protein
MSEPENFLTRWSRRKLVVEEPAPPAAAEAAPPKPAEGEEGAANAAPAEPAFDPASLPSLDSIGAETDITAFLKQGVPGDLRLAALRRAWTTDPAIRNFKGLAENDWDFTVPNAEMGFGEIDPGLDLKKMLSDVFGDTPRTEPKTAELPAPAEQLPAQQQLSSLTDRAALEEPKRDATTSEAPHLESNGDADLLRRDKNAALHTEASDADDVPLKRRRFGGGALPQ